MIPVKMTELIDKQINDKLGPRSKALVHKFQSKKITSQEFDKECAYWLMEYLNLMTYKPDPTMPVDLQELHATKRHATVEFWQLPEIKIYMAECEKVKAINLSNLHWLEFMKMSIPQNDTLNQKKVMEALRTYPKYKIHSTQEKEWYR